MTRRHWSHKEGSLRRTVWIIRSPWRSKGGHGHGTTPPTSVRGGVCRATGSTSASAGFPPASFVRIRMQISPSCWSAAPRIGKMPAAPHAVLFDVPFVHPETLQHLRTSRDLLEFQRANRIGCHHQTRSVVAGHLLAITSSQHSACGHAPSADPTAARLCKDTATRPSATSSVCETSCSG